ncbi:CoA-substrate-specific enzyme activase [Desulfatibacillum aliphaticivorans]|uniref:CoA-substrate-specific enzyme activase n=1 Tax=Desulfatibacillum aliphaticivorans TaxID=218208 RepID=B8FD96_DESAL|nr:acyl-CoA dehydratase activase [Desulfatibacillum aliphaticivorans]ACL06527.1 CoA-substrate-specific enzyme activase [Desulfatibacillum aliphaticivorans]
MDTCFLGIDVGSVSVSLALITSGKDVVQTAYGFHHGDAAGCLNKILNDNFDLSVVEAIAATTSTPGFINADARIDNRVATIAGTRLFHPDVRSILIVGAEKFGLIHFDDQGDYSGYKSNTSCAAGTGSFLDQQANRLNLDGIEDLCRVALSNQGAIPKIASRCAVFAKTDLVHAQQEGYSLPEICDGLCMGLAKNIADTLVSGADQLSEPLVFTGGVSRNKAVLGHLESLMGLKITPDATGAYPAIGAACILADEYAGSGRSRSMDALIKEKEELKTSYFPPLELKLSTHPDFSAQAYLYPRSKAKTPDSVEVDAYITDLPEKPSLTIGLDIGSTSTKAALILPDGRVVGGFYTRTSGRPLNAAQKVFQAVDDFLSQYAPDATIAGAATTGSGRKFIGQIIGADLVLDEITAHARAAVELEPAVDTIIEIGGQDSKFTCLKNGSVVFSTMNTVCAAGTGSFVEEQAQRLGCPLPDYPARAMGSLAPVTSDRCTVFMERDINYFLASGCTQNEMLASTLHSICENYLTKVATASRIGKKIIFTGATAKNKALVAAFEQKLGKQIMVSRYCHLTGALGCALALADAPAQETLFAGLDLYKKDIPVESEVCQLCGNNCKITKAVVNGRTAAFGFLCGRDYDTQKKVDSNTSGFDLFKERKQIHAFSRSAVQGPVVGIPSALHLFDDVTLWRRFFDLLGIRTITSQNYKTAIKDGKSLCRTDFCAPITALHGHVKHLLDKADYVFLPFYLEQKQNTRKTRRQYCYYTQYAPALVESMGSPDRFLSPLVNYLYSSWHVKKELYEAVKRIPGVNAGFMKVSEAYDLAREEKTARQEALAGVYEKQASAADLNVVLLGRPYTILSPAMNKNIPGIFSSMGIRTFYSDMFPAEGKDLSMVRDILDSLHWHYASKILEAAAAVAQTKGAYPVFVTSFRCSPDAFVIDYFKRVMEAFDKPYLVLQLDEHDSAVGYETRIEAAVRSFRTHYEDSREQISVLLPPLSAPREDKVGDKTLVIPNWDPIAMPLVAAALRGRGVDARLLEESEPVIMKSMRHNSGQCVPMNVIAEEFREYVIRHNLDPAQTLLWAPDGKWACNLGVFPLFLKDAINSMGGGLEKAGVYAGNASFLDISMKMPLSVYLCYMLGGFINRAACSIRPYELEKGRTDAVMEKSLSLLAKAFYEGGGEYDAASEVVEWFRNIPVDSTESRPKAALMGDVYVVDNHVMNQDLIRVIEAAGGEAVTTPYSSHLKMVASAYFRRWFKEGLYMSAISSKAFFTAAMQIEKKYQRLFSPLLGGVNDNFEDSFEDILPKYGAIKENTGETMDNIVKAWYLKKQYPDLALIVHTSPAFCCPSMVTEALAHRIEKITGVPFVSVTYDGTGGSKNDAIIPYLKYPKTQKAESVRETRRSF